jgi:pSer/pThr/pTyr-binding forkhead associated (FHA) protein
VPIVIQVRSTKTKEVRRVETFDAESVSIGRVADNDLVLNYGFMSKHHLRVGARSGKLYVIDTHSTAGVYVNRKRIPRNQETPLAQDSVLTFNEIELVVAWREPCQ